MITALELADLLPCRKEPDSWFYESDNSIARAKASCQGCPIKTRCFSLAVENREVHGVWGGEDFNNRKYEPEQKRCRKGVHPKPNPGKCKSCSAEWAKANPGSQDKKKARNKKRSRASNFIGKPCVNHHLLTEENTTLTKQGKLLCKKCIVGRFTRRMK